MPPGVTGLTTCAPVGCDDKIDFCCAVYSGEDQACHGIYNNQALCEILYQLLSIAFPPEVCCHLEGTIEIVTTTTTIPPTTTTTTAGPTTTTSTTTSTTTTTTVPPTTCNCFRVTNNTETIKTYSWKDCGTLAVEIGNVNVGQTIYVCSRIDGFIADPTLTVANLGLCSSECAPITTTTTLPFQIGRAAIIPVPISPNPNLIIGYKNPSGVVIAPVEIAAQPAPLNYRICIKCETTVTVYSGTPNGPITYNDLTGTDCNCVA